MLRRYFSTFLTPKRLDAAILILRIAGGGYMLTHGYPKLMKLMSGDMGFADPIGLGPGVSLILTVFAEFICALLLLVGFGTRIVSIPLMFTMVVAAFVVHGADPFNKKELALIYFVIYAVLFLLGSGRYSLDWQFTKADNPKA